MTQRTYRTANGKVVDLGALQLKNENVRAVGNMPVNARGDLLDSYDRPIQSKPQQVATQYRKQVTNVHDEGVVASKRAKADNRPQVQPVADAAPAPAAEAAPAPAPVAEEVAEESGGLAAAIARARKVKQEPLKTPAQLAQESSGVKKI